MLFKGIKGSDLLEDITLRFRPYAEDRAQIEDVKALSNDKKKEYSQKNYGKNPEELGKF